MAERDLSLFFSTSPNRHSAVYLFEPALFRWDRLSIEGHSRRHGNINGLSKARGVFG